MYFTSHGSSLWVAPSGLRVKLRRPTPSAESAAQQSPGRRPRSLVWRQAFRDPRLTSLSVFHHLQNPCNGSVSICVIQLPSDGFHEDAEQSICNGIGNKTPTETNWEIKMQGNYRNNRLSQNGKTVHNRFDWIGLVCACEIDSPAARNEKARTRPRSNSIFHAATPNVL